MVQMCGMIERRRGARLALKAFERLTVLGVLFREKLQGGEAAELGIFGLEDDTHPPAAELLQNPVMGDHCADHVQEPPPGICSGEWYR